MIELMIVIAIIGILAALALPAYQSYVRKSADNSCLAEATAFTKAYVASLSAAVDVPGFLAVACDTGGPGANMPSTVADLTGEFTTGNSRGSGTADGLVTCSWAAASCKLP